MYRPTVVNRMPGGETARMRMVSFTPSSLDTVRLGTVAWISARLTAPIATTYSDVTALTDMGTPRNAWSRF